MPWTPWGGGGVGGVWGVFEPFSCLVCSVGYIFRFRLVFGEFPGLKPTRMPIFEFPAISHEYVRCHVCLTTENTTVVILLVSESVGGGVSKQPHWHTYGGVFRAGNTQQKAHMPSGRFHGNALARLGTESSG